MAVTEPGGPGPNPQPNVFDHTGLYSQIGRRPLGLSRVKVPASFVQRPSPTSCRIGKHCETQFWDAKRRNTQTDQCISPQQDHEAMQLFAAQPGQANQKRTSHRCQILTANVANSHSTLWVVWPARNVHRLAVNGLSYVKALLIARVDANRQTFRYRHSGVKVPK